jgi:hypothetical protein
LRTIYTKLRLRWVKIQWKSTGSLHWLEVALFTMDMVLFLAVFLAGAAVFAAEVYVETESRIIEAFQRRKA